MSQENNCAGVSFNKVSGWRLATLFKERLRHIFFPVNVEEFSKGQLLNQSNISSNIKKCHVERNVGPV